MDRQENPARRERRDTIRSLDFESHEQHVGQQSRLMVLLRRYAELQFDVEDQLDQSELREDDHAPVLQNQEQCAVQEIQLSIHVGQLPEENLDLDEYKQQSQRINPDWTFGELMNRLPEELRVMICPNFAVCEHATVTGSLGDSLLSSYKLQCELCRHLFPISVDTTMEPFILADTINCPEQLGHWYAATKMTSHRPYVRAVRLMIMDRFWLATKSITNPYGEGREWEDAAIPVLEEWCKELRQWLPRKTETVYIDVSIDHLIETSSKSTELLVLQKSMPFFPGFIQRLWRILERACLRAAVVEPTYTVPRVVTCGGGWEMEIRLKDLKEPRTGQLAYVDIAWDRTTAT